MLGQSELTILVDPHVPSKVFQGITTEITGEGNSVAPVNEVIAKENAPQYEHYGIKRDWADLAGYFARLERQGIGINLGFLRRRDDGARDGRRLRRPAGRRG